MTIRNALFMPAAGLPGTLDDRTQQEVASQLAAVMGGNPARPVIFFCAGAFCWESYNAALRADAAGLSNVYWYRGGLASWAEAGLPMQPLQPQGPASGSQMAWP
jgi:PQQ-dependent catabolism-associated CXXCW motif protein